MESRGYQFTASCPVHGTPLEHRTANVVNGTTTRAVVKCAQCRELFVLEARLLRDVSREQHEPYLYARSGR
jgi:hypothetical protein